MMRKLLFIAVFVSCFVHVYAQNRETIYLTDSTWYKGYIQEQSSNGDIVIYAIESFQKYFLNDIHELQISPIPVSILSERERAFAQTITDSAYVSVASFLYKGSRVDHVFVEDTVPGAIFVRSFKNQSYCVSAALQSSVHKNEEQFVEGYGTKDILILKNGTIMEGHVVTQSLGGMVEFLSFDGVKSSFAISDLYCIRTDKIASVDLWKQVQMLDQLVLMDNTVLTGLMVSRVFGNSVYVKLFNTNEERIVEQKDIRKYQKVWNILYSRPMQIANSPSEVEVIDIYPASVDSIVQVVDNK